MHDTTHRTMTVLMTICAAMMMLTACGDDNGNDSGASDNTPNNAPNNNTPDAGQDEDASESDEDTGDEADVDEPRMFTEPATPPPCDDQRPPIVAAHGFLASGDTYANHAMRFEANGYCLARIHAFDWNTLQRDEPEAALDAFIDNVLDSAGAEQVELMGHSAGGGLGYTYLADPARAARVAHYVHIGSFVNDGPAGPEGMPVPTLNLWSEGDLVVEDKGDINGATNVRLIEEDHYSVATSDASFEAIYRFFNEDQTPAETDIVADEPLYISGKALTLGENIPEAGGVVEIFALDETGGRVGEAVAVFQVAEDGRWGPFIAEPETHYEFRVQPAAPDGTPVHYYREAFRRSNNLVYLRTLPAPGSLAGTILSLIPFEEDASVVVIFTSNRGLNDATDSLTVNGQELATPALASPDQTTIALFIYDADGDDQSSGDAVLTFGSFPFLNGADLFIPADAESTIDVVFNGRRLPMRAWPSASEGATIAVFE